MKKISTLLAVLSAIAFLAFPSAPRAQSITIDSISATTFCAGDPVSVTFTVTGNWKQYNAFTLQLSDPTGSFTSGSFTNLGSVIDSIPGKFTIVSTIPIHAASEPPTITTTIKRDTVNNVIDSTMIYDTTSESHYRVRVIGAYPYTASADNGSNLVIGGVPLEFVWDVNPADSILPWATGIGCGFRVTTATSLGLQDFGGADTIIVDYGEGANPATSIFSGSSSAGNVVAFDALHTIYSTAGLKKITIKTITQGGCYASSAMYLKVLDCSTPSIPNDAIIISQKGQKGTAEKTYWVNPGIPFQASGGDTIFAEAGATITGNFANIVYLKPGASADADLNGIVFYAPGASVDKSMPPTVECDSLTFDYTVAPPNAVMGINVNEGVVMPAAPAAPIEISPNPTSGIVMLEGIPANANVTALNVLGETVQEVKAPGTPYFTLDLSKMARGTYYIRIASNGGVTTKKIVKE